ncbi:MAG: excalibur calcium-binding domain-containing protein [Pseudonocardiaceae bacterium]|nr:MAG: excalibur calcium-binding domain-containing protein [Pseudonocardiaceae bacterium]
MSPTTTTTTTTTTSATPTTVVPVVPAQVPLPTTRVAVKTVAPQGLVAPPTTKKQAVVDPGSGGGSAYYKNCAAVRAAGKAPILRGQPGYASHLDRDGDGIGCE